MNAHPYYPSLGGDVAHAAAVLNQLCNWSASIVLLYSEMHDEVEVGMNFGSKFQADASNFRDLTDAILDGYFSNDLSTPNQICIKLANATKAKAAVVFAFKKDGTVRIGVSKPLSNELVAAPAFKIAMELEANWN